MHVLLSGNICFEMGQVNFRISLTALYFFQVDEIYIIISIVKINDLAHAQCTIETTDGSLKRFLLGRK